MNADLRREVVGQRVAGTTMGIGVADPENPSHHHRDNDSRHNDILACFDIKVRDIPCCIVSRSLASEGPEAFVKTNRKLDL